MKTIRTIIVDDEPRIRRGIERHVLSLGEGWEVAATASNGLEALECFERLDGAVDLLITDVRMPEMDGLTLIREAKKRFSFHPLLISGYDDFQYLQTAIREGALDYILKPVDREQFRNRMEEIRTFLFQDKYQNQKFGEMEREAERLRKSRQTQTLSYMTSSNADTANLGYWVDEFPGGRYLLQLIRLDRLPVKARNYTSADWKAFFYALENIVGEVVGDLQTEYMQSWSFLGSESDFWVLLYCPAEKEELCDQAYRLAERIRSSIQTYTPFTVSVAYGSPIDDLYLLPVAKRQAMAVINFRLLHGGNRIFLPPEGEENQSKATDKELAGIFVRLKRGIEQGQSQELKEILHQLFGYLDRIDSPTRLEATVQNVVILVHCALLESDHTAARAFPIDEELHRIRAAVNMQELRQFINDLVNRVVGEIHRSRQSDSMKTIELAKSWIQVHLAGDVTIKKIAEQVHMNPTYFSEYFKQQTGETILDYLTRKRMERAKELLADPRLKIQEIGVRIGYQDVKYFSRLFKNWTGQTPSGYRDRIVLNLGGESSAGKFG